MALRISTPRLTSAITLNSFAPQFLGQLRLPSFLSIYQWRDTWQRASLSAVLAEIFGPFLWAVPKQKTSYRRKRIRAMANSSLKDVTNFGKWEIDTCQGRGDTNDLHHDFGDLDTKKGIK
ncbi:hypothetical protein G9A89_006991 [Geosiphon pyriformis]|nr:hypothetical protein G9A89_006991 [Geosiphon pyriformis]